MVTGANSHNKRHAFKTKRGQPHSLDVEDGLSPTSHTPEHLKRGSSENNLVAEFLGVPNREHSGSKFSLIDKFADVSKAISDKQNSKTRTKTPFSLFKKARDASPQPGRKKKTRSVLPPSHLHLGGSDYSDSGEEMLVEEPRGRKPIKKTLSEGSYGSDALEFEADSQGLEAYLDLIDEYYYGVRVFPGQDPACVYVGWVTPGFHQYNSSFEMKKIRNVVVCAIDVDYQATSR